MFQSQSGAAGKIEGAAQQASAMAVPVGLGAGLSPLEPAATLPERPTPSTLSPEADRMVELFAQSETLIRQLRLPRDIACSLREQFCALRDAMKLESAEPTAAQRVFVRALLLAPEIQALKAKFEFDTQQLGSAEFHRAQVAMLGSIYLWGKFCSTDPALASEILRGMEGAEVNWNQLSHDLRKFYSSLGANDASFIQLFVRQFESRAGVAETAFIGGVLAPMLMVMRFEVVPKLQMLRNWFRNLVNKTPQQIEALGVVTEITVPMRESLETLYSHAKGHAREDVGPEQFSYDGADIALRMLIDSASTATGQQRFTVLNGLWERVRTLQSCSEEDLALLLQVAREFPGSGIGVPSGLLSAAPLIKGLPASERRSASGDFSAPLPVEVASLVRALAIATERSVTNTEKFEKIVSEVGRALEPVLAQHLNRDLAADTCHALAKHALKIIGARRLQAVQ